MKLLPILLLLLISACGIAKTKTDIHLRMNQLGFLPNEYKSAIVFSKYDLKGTNVHLINKVTGEKICTNVLKKTIAKWGKFNYNYKFDFTSVDKEGQYYITIGDEKSNDFVISNDVYSSLKDSILKFFQVQRCGYTNPILHNLCHQYDASQVLDEYGKDTKLKLDLTGGWHDAADYIKFINTTAFSTYMLLFAYEFNTLNCSNDNNKNGIPDVLEEAKIGLDWLLRCNVDGKRLINVVQDLRDHNQGWRLPEDDNLRYDRPAFISTGKNTIGMYVAALSLGARIWKNVVNYPDYAQKLLSTAELIYKQVDSVADLDENPTKMYQDSKYEGKLALGEVELYLTTKNKFYLDNAQSNAEKAGSDLWWSWGNINSLAHYRLAKINKKNLSYILTTLNNFSKYSNKDLFGKSVDYSWGTTHCILGTSLQCILWKDLTKSNNFDTLATLQKDYILGKNNWGVSFIYGVGYNYTSSFHCQVSFFNDRYSPGAIAAGPVPTKLYNSYNIIHEKKDKYSEFQNEEGIYYDDRMDYLTNEPTIVTNATAYFVFSNIDKIVK